MSCTSARQRVETGEGESGTPFFAGVSVGWAGSKLNSTEGSQTFQAVSPKIIIFEVGDPRYCDSLDSTETS